MASSIFDLRDQLNEGQTSHAGLDLAFRVERPRRWRKAVKITLTLVLMALAAGSAASYFYWQHLKTTPQYSLAMLIDASRRGDQTETGQLIDTDRVVDNFIPQITSKAIEMYGRGLPNVTIQRIADISAPLIPAVKGRARAEIPNVIRDRTEQFQSIPFSAMVLGADRYLQIDVDGNTAFVKSKLPDRPFEIKMQKNADRWKIVAVKDEQLATTIAQRIGQDIIAIASRGNTSSNDLGIRNLSNIVRQAEELFKDN